MHSMTKVISLSNEAYKKMKAMKTQGESFSDVVLRLANKTQKPLSDFIGKWPCSKEEINRISNYLKNERKKFKLQEVKFD